MELVVARLTDGVDTATGPIPGISPVIAQYAVCPNTDTCSVNLK
jgi:hypothetical protein